MAKEVITKLIDDLDNTEAAETVTFGLDGVSYEVDLSNKNSAKLRTALEQYIAAGTRVGKVKRNGSRPPQNTADRERSRAIREWARRQGKDVSDRGRIPEEIVLEYDRAQRAPQPVKEKPKRATKRATTAKKADATPTAEPAFSEA